MSILSDIYSNISSTFSFFKDKNQTSNPTKMNPRRPANVDFTDSLQCNSALTKGLYHNSYPGMKLAGSMCFTPIAVPIWLMGIPVPKTKKKNAEAEKLLKEITEDMILKFYENHKQSHRDGTSWIFPFYSSIEKKLVWEFIQDDVICDIIRDLITGKIIKLITDEEITITTDYNKTATIRRQRIYTESKIEIKYISGSGIIPANLKDRTQRNVFGIMPIPFSNNKDADEIRGHSDYERILSDLKNYHDHDLKESQLLTKFSPKMVQYGANGDDWFINNGYKNAAGDAPDLSNFDPSTIDFIFNLYEREKTEYIFPDKAYEAYQAKLKNIFRKIVEGSGIPEILWGTKVEGNKASADQQMDLVVKLVEDKRMQKSNAYQKLYEDTLKLKLSSAMVNTEIEIEIEWNKLDAVSEETKSIIFKNFAEGMNKLITVAGITKEQVFKLWNQLNPTATEDDFKKFKKGLTEMASHAQFVKMPFELAADFQGIQDIDTDIEIDEPEEPTDEPGDNGNGNGEINNAIKIIQQAIKEKHHKK